MRKKNNYIYQGSKQIAIFISLAAVLILFVTTRVTAQQAGNAGKTNSARYIEALMRRDSVPGAAVAVIKAGKPVYKQYFGYANLENKIKVSSRSIFQIASVTKQFTAAGIMLLSEAGKLKPEDRITQYFPGAPASWGDITIENLLTHTSGIMNYEDVGGFAEKAYLDSAHATVVNSIVHSLYGQQLLFAPGSRSEYCNSNYFLLGVIIEKVTGVSYTDFLTHRVLQPLGMHNTLINQMYRILPGRVAGYSGRDHALINADRLGMDWFFAEGNIVSDLDDLSRWALFPDGKLLKAKSLSRMFSVKKLSDGSNGKFGYGWFIDTGNPKIVYHSGHTPGFSAFVYRDATRNIAVVMLFNNDSVPTAGLLEAAKKLDSYNW